MSNMREEFENWCAQNKANPNNYYFSKGWQAAWYARDAEVEALKSKHAELIEALRVVVGFGLSDPIRFMDHDDFTIVTYQKIRSNNDLKQVKQAVKTINAAIRE